MMRRLVVLLCAITLLLSNCGGHSDNTSEGVVHRFFEAIEEGDANKYLDALDPELRDEPGFGAAGLLLQSIAAFFGVPLDRTDVTNIEFRDLTVEEVANDGTMGLVHVSGMVRNLSLFQEEAFDQTLATKRIQGTWYVSTATDEEAQETLEEHEVPGALGMTFEGPNRCVVVRYPAGWTVEDYANLQGGRTARCPGGEQASGTMVLEPCNEVAGYASAGIVDVVGPGDGGSVSEGGTAPAASVSFVHARCRELDETVKRFSQGLSREFAWAEDGVHQRVVAGQSATCLEGTLEAQGEYEAIWFRHCFLLLSGDLYLVSVAAPQNGREAAQSILEQIMASIELHPLSR